MSVRRPSGEISSERRGGGTGAFWTQKLRRVIVALAGDETLEQRHRDHALPNDWNDYRDCHVKPDLVLIYRQIGDDRLILARLGLHSELDL